MSEENNNNHEPTKQKYAELCAIIALLAGILCCYINMFLPPRGEVTEGALWVLGQCLMYSGGIYGIKLYIDGKLQGHN